MAISFKTCGGFVKRQTSMAIPGLMSFKVLVMAFCGLSVVSVALADRSAIGNSAEVVSQPEGEKNDQKQDIKLLNRAVRVIRQTMKRAHGTPYFVSCQYKIKDNKPVAASTEVHYTDYRKKSDARSVEFTRVDGRPDRVVDFVYKPNSKTLAVVERDPVRQGRRLATRRVSLDI